MTDRAADSEKHIRRLMKTAGQVLDPAMRKHFLVAKFRVMEDEEIAEAIYRMQSIALAGDSEARVVVASGLDAGLILRKLGKVRVGRIYHEAKRRGYLNVCNLFRSLRPLKSPEGDEEAFLKYGLPDLTVGERKAAARSRDPNMLARVGYDPDPLVIRQLLKNPRVIEKMVVTITARRPNRPEVLEIVYRSAKWRARPEVRRALVRNPYTAPHLAMALVPMLNRQELEDVAYDGNIHPEVREAAENALEAKKQALQETEKENEPPAKPSPETWH